MTLCADLGLSGEAVPLVAHAVHEELIKHKRDAIEWGVLGGDTHSGGGPAEEQQPDKPRDRSGLSLLKDKTGLGLSWGRAPKDGRGPKPLRSVWRDWAEAEEFRTRFEVLTAEEVDRREIERERATRYVRCLFVMSLLLSVFLPSLGNDVWSSFSLVTLAACGGRRPSFRVRQLQGGGGSSSAFLCPVLTVQALCKVLYWV